MTNEELKQEAKIYSYKLYHSKAWNPGEDMLVKAYLAGAEPREKQIQIDAEQIRALQKQNGELTDKVKELEAQLEREKNLNQCLSDHNEQLRELIEKMKCCENCKYYNNHYNEVVCKRQVINCKRILRQATRDQWEIKENE